MICQYDEPWQGICGKETNNETEYCEKHIVKCYICRERQSTHGCSVAASMVCGTPLCSDKDCISKHMGRHY